MEHRAAIEGVRGATGGIEGPFLRTPSEAKCDLSITDLSSVVFIEAASLSNTGAICE